MLVEDARDGEPGPVRLFYAVHEGEEARACELARNEARGRYTILKEPVDGYEPVAVTMTLSPDALHAIVPSMGQVVMTGSMGPARFIA